MNIYIFNRSFRVTVTEVMTLQSGTIDFLRGTILTEGQYNIRTNQCHLPDYMPFIIPLQVMCSLNREYKLNSYSDAYDLYEDLIDNRPYELGHASHLKINTSLLEYYDTGRASLLIFKEREVHNPLGEKYADYFKYTPIKIYSKVGFYISGYMVRMVNKCLESSERILTYDHLVPGFNKNTHFSTDAITKECKFLVKDYGNSAKLFKFTELKKSLVGKVLEGTDIELEAKVKNSEEIYQTIKLILEDGRKSRFLLSDVEIIYPNLKSFNPPKDRELKIGATARLTDNRKTGIPKHSLVKVVDIKKVGNKKYAIVDCKNKKVYTNYKSLKVC